MRNSVVASVKATCRRPTVSLIIIGSVFASLCVALAQTQPNPTKPRGRPFVARVATLEDLQPKSAIEKAKAAEFDDSGPTRPLEPGDDVMVGSEAPPAVPPWTQPPAYLSFVSTLACAVDAVVVGKAEPKAVRGNNRGTFLYTEYSFAIERWLRPAGRGPATIELIAGGGHVRVGRRLMIVRAGQELYPGDEYLLFLRHVRGTNAYVAVGRPITPESDWRALLGAPQLPYELRDHQVPFGGFVDDLEMAQCNKGPRK